MEFLKKIIRENPRDVIYVVGFIVSGVLMWANFQNAVAKTMETVEGHTTQIEGLEQFKTETQSSIKAIDENIQMIKEILQGKYK